MLKLHMNKNELAAKFTSDEDEKLLLCRVMDKYNAMRNGGYMTSTGFMSDRVAILAERLLRHLGATNNEYFFDGGYDWASRKILVFVPDYMTEEECRSSENSPLRFVHVSYYKEYTLSHRDFLGSLLGDGVSRDVLGDILVNDSDKTTDIVVCDSILSYMLHSFFTVGRAKVDCTEISREALYAPEQKTETVKDTVASLRLDAVISSALGMSRDKASQAVARGLVELNHFPCSKGERLLSEGDTVTVRGFGKFVLSNVGALSKKGRIFVEIKRLV